MKFLPTSAGFCTASLAVLILTGLGRPVSAQILTTASSSAPASNVQISNTNVASPGNITWRWDSASNPAEVDLGQSFTPTSSFALSGVTMRLDGGESSGALGANFTLTLYTYAGTTGSAGYTPTSTVASFTGTLPATTLNGYVTFATPSTILASGTIYGYLLAFNTEATGESLGFYQSTTDVYAGGELNKGNPGNYSAYGDLQFYIQGTLVPEPSTKTSIVLGAMGLLTGFLRLRKNSAGSLRV